MEEFMNKYRVTFKGGLTIPWSSEYKPSRQDIKDLITKTISKMSPEEIADYLKITSVEEVID
jgi:hypothetical protein